MRHEELPLMEGNCPLKNSLSWCSEGQPETRLRRTALSRIFNPIRAHKILPRVSHRMLITVSAGELIDEHVLFISKSNSNFLKLKYEARRARWRRIMDDIDGPSVRIPRTNEQLGFCQTVKLIILRIGQS